MSSKLKCQRVYQRRDSKNGTSTSVWWLWWLQTGRKSEREDERMMSPLSTSSVSRGAVTLLPPPTWNILSRPHTNSHTQWQKIPVPVAVPPVFICFHTYKTISGSSSPHVAPAEQLRCRITGVNSAESFPVSSSTEEKITHTTISSAFPKVLTMLPFLQGKAQQGGPPTEELVCEFGCLCVGAGFL